MLVDDVAGYSRLVHRDEEARMPNWPRSQWKVSRSRLRNTAAASNTARILATRYLPNRGKGDLFFLYPTAGSAHVDR
jgi:hypothetical protein